jgi:putative acetyltransferase
MLIRREAASDVAAVRAVVTAAFAPSTAEAELVDALRAGPDWLPALSLVAEVDGEVVGHVVCSRARLGPSGGRGVSASEPSGSGQPTPEGAPVLGLGPLAVAPAVQRRGVGSALVHAVLGAADALDEPLVVLLGHADYYPRFGFRPAAELGVEPPVAEWAPHFQARPLTSYTPSLQGAFRYAAAFDLVS